MAGDLRIDFIPLHANITADDWGQELDGVEILQEPSPSGKFEYWICLVGLASRIYLHLRLPDDDDVLAVMEVTVEPQPVPSWEVLAQFDETGRGRCFADVYVLLRQLGFDRWMLKRSAGEPYRHGLRSWTYCIFTRLIAHEVFRFEDPNSTTEPLKHLRNALFPSSSDLRESMCYCPELAEYELGQRNVEWTGYKAWRQELDKPRLLETDEPTENVLERLERQIKPSTRQATS